MNEEKVYLYNMNDQTLNNFVKEYNNLFDKYDKMNTKKIEKLFTEIMIKWTGMKYNNPIRYSLDFLLSIIYDHGKTSWLKLQNIEYRKNIMVLLHP